MKTTVELPDDLIREAKIRAAVQNRRLKDVLADALRRGLAAEPTGGPVSESRVQLPLVECAHPAPSGAEITPDRAADILVAEEASAVGASER